MQWANSESQATENTRGQTATRTEAMKLVNEAGTTVAQFSESAGGVVAFSVNGGVPFIPPSVPEIAATPTAQGIVDALVILGLVTQAEA